MSDYINRLQKGKYRIDCPVTLSATLHSFGYEIEHGNMPVRRIVGNKPLSVMLLERVADNEYLLYVLYDIKTPSEDGLYLPDHFSRLGFSLLSPL